METVRVRNIVIGEGLPKICVPVVERTKDDILEETRYIAGLGADLLEFRADCFEDVRDSRRLEEVLAGIREIIGDMPLLLTVRTSAEGGAFDAEAEAYRDIILRAIRSGLIDLADVEISKGPELCRQIISTARAGGVSVVASSHDFSGTPAKEEITDRLLTMQEYGADILKIAVMPHSTGDVMTLLDASSEMAKQRAAHPLIAIAMGNTGSMSRIACEIFGSAVTFGSASKESAPGQMSVPELRAALLSVHSAMARNS